MGRILGLVGLLLGSVACAWATTYLVLPNGTGDFPTIQAAVDAAVDGDVIELGNGTFTGDGNRDLDLLGKAITVRSGSGNPEACIIDCQGGSSDRHRGFHLYSGEISDTQICGLKIVNGYAPNVGGDDMGGAIFIHDYTYPTVMDCVFENNRADEGGAVATHYYAGGTFTNCLFRENEATYTGGAVADDFVGHTTYENCQFTENNAANGGAAYSNYAHPGFVDCLFAGNTASGTGGAIYMATVSGGGGAAGVTGCTFFGNWADISGGAIGCGFYCAPTILNSTLCGNYAPVASGIAGPQQGLSIDHTIIAYGHGGSAVTSGFEVYSTCCDIFGNDGGDWGGFLAEQLDLNGNISLAPFFCGSIDGDFTLSANSPCAAENNPECGQIGAFGIGCEAASGVPEPPVSDGEGAISSTWGGVKALFREQVQLSR